MVDHYQNTFPLAKTYSQVLGAVPTLLSVASYWLDPSQPAAKFMLAGGLTLLMLGPFTVCFIKPTNDLLLDGDSKSTKTNTKFLWFQEQFQGLLIPFFQILKRRGMNGSRKLWMSGVQGMPFEF